MLQKHSTAFSNATPVYVNFEVDFLPVGENGSGDAICIRYGDDSGFYVHVVDGGYTDTAETIINHITKHYGPNVVIHHMVLSHADDDHARGLIGVLQHFTVLNLWMNRPWLYCAEVIQHFHGNWTLAGLEKEIKAAHSYLVDLEAIANEKGTVIHEVFQGAQIGAFTVLAPSRDRYVSLIPDLGKTPDSYADKSLAGTIWEGVKTVVNAVREAWDYETLDENPDPTSASNETSVVQLGVFGDKQVLLTADVGPDGLAEAASYAASRGLLSPPNLVQVPHHGSRRNVTPSVLNEWLGGPLEQEAVIGTAVCSVSKGKSDKYPRKTVANAFRRRGYPVHTTAGEAKSHREGYPMRLGWSSSTPVPFYTEVDDE